MNTAIQILFLTDIHGAEFQLKEIAKEISSSDLILLGGDNTHFGNKKQMESLIETMVSWNSNIYAVSGNCDYPDVEEYLKITGIGLYQEVKVFKGYSLTGLSGSLPCPGTTPNEFSEEEAQEMLKTVSAEFLKTRLSILVSHQPPVNTINDRLDNGWHVGCRALREFIETTHPLVCLTGHIHEGKGIDRIGQCMVINPGSFRDGYYARITINGENSVNADLKHIAL